MIHAAISWLHLRRMRYFYGVVAYEMACFEGDIDLTGNALKRAIIADDKHAT